MCAFARVCLLAPTLCVLWWHIVGGRRSVVRGAFGGSQAGIKGYGLSHKWTRGMPATWLPGCHEGGGGGLDVCVCVNL